MQSTSWETLDWKKHKLESRLPGERSITSDDEALKSLLMRLKEESEKADSSLNISFLFSTYKKWRSWHPESHQFSLVQSLSHVRLFATHESQHARPPCPSPTPRVHSNSCLSSQRCHPAISSSLIPFSSCPQSLPASESFLMSQLLAWGGQSIGVSALASVLPKDTQD